MKTSIFFTFILIACGLLHAQPALNSCANGYQAGDAYSGLVHSVDTTGFFPVQLGSNVTWNFSNLTSTSNPYNSTFVTVASTPNPGPFAAASIAEDQGNGAYYFSNYAPNAATYHGYYINANTCNTYADPIVQYSCPLSFGASFTDTYAGSACNGFTFTGNRTGTYAGYGTLILPHTTFQGAVLIHTFDTLRQGFFDTYYEYFTWYDGTNNIGRLAAVRIGNSLAPGTTNSITYLEITGSSVGRDEAALAAQIQVYPNPATTSVQVEVPAQIGRGAFRLLDLQGRTVLQSPIQVGQGQVALPELNPGLYLYEVSDRQGQRVKTGKLMKE